MKHHWLATTAVCVLAYASGAIADEPMLDRNGAEPTGSTESWGDPEEENERSRTWTWFGMGYERRTQAGSTSATPESRAANGTSQQQRSGRK